MGSLTQSVAVEARRFGVWEGAGASPGAICTLVGVDLNGAPVFSSVLGAGALPAAKAPLFVLEGLSTTGGAVTAGDTVRVLERGMVRAITFPGAAPTPGITTPVYYGDAGGLELVPAVIGTWLLGYVVAAGALTYDAWFDGGMQWGAPGAITGADGVTIDAPGGLAEVKDAGVSWAKLGNGPLRCPGVPASGIIDFGAVTVGSTATVTYAGTVVVYEVTDGGAPGGGHIGVDKTTIATAFPAAVAANQPDLKVYASFAVFGVAVGSLAAVVAGNTLALAGAGGVTTETTTSAAAAGTVGIEHYLILVTAANASLGIVFPVLGTLLGATFSEVHFGTQWIGTPLTDFNMSTVGSTRVLQHSVVAGRFIDAWFFVQY